MSKIFIGKNELLNKQDFDSKVNVALPLSRRLDKLDHIPNDLYDIQGSNIGGDGEAVLQIFRDTNEPGKLTLGELSSGITFGVDNTRGILNVHWNDHRARIIGSNADSDVSWSEDIAWKSDIQKLQDQIDVLKKANRGGVKPIYRLYYAISAKEVA